MEERHPDGDEPRIQDFFVRELAEVYLLLDNVSASSSKSLSARRTAPAPPPGEDVERRTRDIVAPGSDPEVAAWIKRICEVGWPPQGTEGEQASQAATLILAKDYLNAMAAPATGATIAFTLLVAGEDNPAEEVEKSRLDRFREIIRQRFRAGRSGPGGGGGGRAGGGGAGGAGSGDGGWGEIAPSRTSLARLAYPGLVSAASTFRRRILWVLGLLGVWLVVTCLLSWDVAVGNGFLKNYADLKTARADISKQIVDAETSRDKASTGAAAGETGGQADAHAQAGPFVRFCDRRKLIPPGSAGVPSGVPQFNDAIEQRLCDAWDQNGEAMERARGNLIRWQFRWQTFLEPSRWLLHPACFSRIGRACDELERRRASDAAEDGQRAAVLLSVLGGSVLPICYGLLGAGATMVRGLSAKMRESLLSPRDFTLALIQLSLGAVIGACIGLFATPASADGDPKGGLLAAVPLSASALCFIAGFGVDGVFLALEGLISRVFGLGENGRRTS